MLAGNIVQVRPERKALSAAVGPTCCSGREQRSKTASAGGAIPFFMKTTLRKELRVRRHHARAVRNIRSAPALDLHRASMAESHGHPLVGVDGAGRRLGMGAATMIEPRGFRRRRRCWTGTCGWIHWRQNREWSTSYELLAVQIGARQLQH
jgi:hypothetical protein